MKCGVLFFTTDTAMPPGEVARALEERGFESLWAPEHVHIPVHRTSKSPGTGTVELPDRYLRILDPFVALTVAACATTTLKVATGVCLVSEREPIALAKQIASLDLLSNGRFLFGIGAGWLKEELEILGVPFATRWALTAERIAAMKWLWQEAEAEFHGQYVNFPRTIVYPKPLQQPHPPIIIGAKTPWARQRTVEWADGWLPYLPDPAELGEALQDLRQRARAAGRDPESIETSVFRAKPEFLKEYQRLGVDRCVFEVTSGAAAQAIPEMDRLAKAIMPFR